MTRENDNAAPGGQPERGARETTRSQDDFPPSKAGTQRQKLLRYLERNGHISTMEARAALAILAPAARIWELRHQGGFRILTHRDHHRVARYILLPGQEPGGTHGCD